MFKYSVEIYEVTGDEQKVTDGVRKLSFQSTAFDSIWEASRGIMLKALALMKFFNKPSYIVNKIKASFYQPKEQVYSDKVTTLDAIAECVSQYFHIPLGRLISATRVQEIAEARQIAMYLSRHCTNSTCETIAFKYGRDHATVLYSCNVVGEKMINEPVTAQQVADIKALLKLEVEEPIVMLNE